MSISLLNMLSISRLEPHRKDRATAFGRRFALDRDVTAQFVDDLLADGQVHRSQVVVLHKVVLVGGIAKSRTPSFDNSD